MPVDRDTYTRLFIMGGKGLCKEDYRDAFSKFGVVTDIFMAKDRKSNDLSGKHVVFILHIVTQTSC